ncbi:MAG: hypothetical protein WDM86_10880 [Rhizomicrobium sp.]
MPDSNGMLTPVERDTIAKHMQVKLKAQTCPWCGQTRWEIGPALATNPAVYADGSIHLIGPTVPMVTLISPCGYMTFFAAKMFGLVLRDAKTGDTPTPAPAAG